MMKIRKRDILVALFGLLSYVVPKKKGVYGCMSIHDKSGWTGNIKAFMLYAKKAQPELIIELLAFDKALAGKVKKHHIKVTSNRMVIFWKILRAEHLILDSTSLFIRKGNFSVVQLNHGVGFKNIGLLNDHSTRRDKKYLKEHCRKFSLVAATSQSDLEKKNRSYATQTAKITGQPRNDVFFENSGLVQILEKKYQTGKYEKVITYAPTFRDFETASPFSDGFWERLQDYLENKNILFAVKKHPWDKLLKVPENFPNIRDFTSVVSDPQELLLLTDILISDYSSIMTDFALTDKPILVFAYDYKLYIEKCRSMYYNLEEILPKPFLQDEEDLLKALKQVVERGTSENRESYKNFKETFHYYLDGDSSKRVLKEIEDL